MCYYIINHKEPNRVVFNFIYKTSGTHFTEIYNIISVMLKLLNNICVCRDFNIDLLRRGTHNNTKAYLVTMYSLGLYPLIDKLTRTT